jgi:rhamnosyl/mannosyltransferase
MSVKAVLVNKLYYPVIGGVESHVRDLAVFLPREVKRKVLACFEKRGPRRTEVIEGVEVVKAASLGTYFSSPLPLGFRRELRVLSRWADLFHFHFPFPPGELAFLTSGIKKPLIVTYHSDIVRQKALLKIYQPFLIRFLKRADVIIATSPRYIETSPYLSAFKEKCRVIPLGIDTAEFELDTELKELISQVKSEVGAPFVLFVGRLIYYKGVEYLIRAFKKVPEPYKLVIIGSGPLKDELLELSRKAELQNRVIFYESQPRRRLIAFYYACEFFVLPSVERSEAFGIVQLEAQACGKPVISTELGTGTSFANLDGVTGIVVPPRDVEALESAMITLATNERLRAELGKNAFTRVRQEFDVKVMAAHVAELYREVITGAATSSKRTSL